jgi:hypothetical protein
MIKNRLFPKRRTKLKQITNKIALTASREREIKNYRNLVDNKKRIINLKILEEKKNLENSLTKITKKFNNIKASKLRNQNQNFSNDYNTFSKNHFKPMDLLMQDLSDIYLHKGYQIKNLQSNLFKMNPLLENRTNKIFFSYLSMPNYSNKGNKHNKYMNKNKPIKYMKKLEKIISPDSDNKEKNKSKAQSLTQLLLIKKRLKIKNQKKKNQRLNNSIRSLINLINNNLSTIDFPTRKRNKSVKNNNNNEMKSFPTSNNSMTDDIKDEKKVNYDTGNSLKRNNYSNKNTTINSFSMFKNKKNNNNNELICKNHYATSLNSTKNLIIPKLQLNGLYPLKINNNTDIGENETISNTERTGSKNKMYRLKTPRIIKNPNCSNEKTKTKTFSITNENSSSNRSKIDNSKSKEYTFFKIKEFTVNSYKSSNSNTFNQTSMGKVKYSNKKINKEVNSNKNIPMEFRISTPKKLFNKDEDNKEKNINKMYKLFNFGEVKDAEKNIRYYLSKFKQLNQKEINEMMSKYNYQNNNTNLLELQNLISEKKISSKIFRLYLNNNDFNRIEPLLKILNEKDKKIMQFDKKIAQISNNS